LPPAFDFFNCIWQHWTSYTTTWRFHASSAVHASLSLFWDVTQPTLADIYRRFGKTYRSCLQGQAVQEGNSTLEDGTDSLSRNVGKIPCLRDWKNFCTASLSLSVGVWLQIQWWFDGVRVNISKANLRTPAFEDSVLTSQSTHSLPIEKNRRLILH
jgi:hypothetical protein